MIGDFINRIRPEPQPRPDDAPQTLAEPRADATPETPTYSGSVPQGDGPIGMAGARPAPTDGRETTLSPEDPAFDRAPEPAPPVAEAAPAVPETEAPEDTHPEADVRDYDLGTADWRYSRADTRRRLPREETDTLICSAKVEGTAVYDPDGKKLGRVETVMLHKTTGRVEYAVVRLPGGLVSGETYRPVPWADLRYDEAAGGYQIDADRQALKRDRSFETGRGA